MCLATPAIIREFIDETTAKVDLGAGVLKTVSIAFLDDLTVGDQVLVHSGFAISRLNPEEAREIWEALRELDEQQ